jgi:phosphoribosyl-AMP cyclohydrolase
MLDFKKGNGLVPAICQDYETGEVLMLAYVNEDAWNKTLVTREAHYWSRSRQEIWHKGETSGHVQKIREILIDCDRDTILYKVDQVGGAACHTGHRSCFHYLIENGDVVEIGRKVFDPAEVYKK